MSSSDLSGRKLISCLNVIRQKVVKETFTASYALGACQMRS